MKPVRIDFFASRRWAWVWTGAVATAFVIGAVAVTVTWRVKNEADAAQAALGQMAQDVARLKASRTLPPDPRELSARRMAASLQADIDKVLLPLERLAQDNVRLVGVQLDHSSGEARVEYEFAAIQQIQRITEELNAGYESNPWKFEGAQVQQGAGVAVPFPVRASWRVATRHL